MTIWPEHPSTPRDIIAAYFRNWGHLMAHDAADGVLLMLKTKGFDVSPASSPVMRMTQEEFDGPLGYATHLACCLWEKHWKDQSPHWKPLPDLLGVLTQIDNMTAGLARGGGETAGAKSGEPK